MTIVRTAIYRLFVFCLPLLIITSNIGWGVSEIRLYEYSFDKYHISQTTGIDDPELRKIFQHLIDYFNLRVDSVQVTVTKGGEQFGLFNEREVVHLEDVRDLIQLNYWVQRGALLLMVICALMLLLWLKAGWRTLVRGLFWGSLAVLGLVVVLALWALFGFEQLFILFHVVSFPNEFWMLDPSRDYLIMLFPGGFFYDAAMFGFGAVILEGVLVSGIAFGVLKTMGWRMKGSEAK